MAQSIHLYSLLEVQHVTEEIGEVMKIRIKRALATGALAISLGALALGVAGINPALAETSGAPPTPEIIDDISSTTLGSSTQTLSWCGWYLSGVSESIQLVPVDDPDTVGLIESDGPDANKYDGTEILIGASDSDISLFVNGNSSYLDDADNCSWYGDPNKQEVWVSVEASGVSFDAVSDNAGPDSSMNFDLENSNPLNLNVVPDQFCVPTYGFSIDAEASIYDVDSLESFPVKSNSQASVGTTDMCSWTVNYVTSIPSGLVPVYGDALYTYTGPLLTTTMEVQE